MGCYITIRQDLERCVSVFVNHGHTFGFHRFGVHIAVGIYAEAAVRILERIGSNVSADSDIICIATLAVRIVFYSSFVQFIEIALNLAQLAFCRRTIQCICHAIPSRICQSSDCIVSICINSNISSLNTSGNYQLTVT